MRFVSLNLFQFFPRSEISATHQFLDCIIGVRATDGRGIEHFQIHIPVWADHKTQLFDQNQGPLPGSAVLFMPFYGLFLPFLL